MKPDLFFIKRFKYSSDSQDCAKDHAQDAERKQRALFETNAECFQHFGLSFRAHEKHRKRSKKIVIASPNLTNRTSPLSFCFDCARDG